MSALERQIGGNHYKTKTIQPITFILVNDWDFAAGCIVKHITRHRDKDGLKDIEKARHYIELREALWGPWLYPQRVPANTIRAVTYAEANSLGELETGVLINLERWVENLSEGPACRRAMFNYLSVLASEYETINPTAAAIAADKW